MSDKSHHFHHIYSLYSFPELIRYDSVCGISDEEYAPVLKDEANEKIKKSFSKPSETKDYPEYTSPFEDEVLSAETAEQTVSAADISTEPEISGFEKFCYEQKDQHSRFYFFLGLTIFLVLLLGIISGVYLVLNKMNVLNL